MGNSLLIVGAGMYGQVANEIALEMECYDKIDFIDDNINITLCGKHVIGKIDELPKFQNSYKCICVAIGNSKFRLNLLKKINESMRYSIISLISPKAYIATSATILQGCIIEPMVVVNAGSVISNGCILSAGAVINHFSICESGVHVDCNATIMGNCRVPANMKIKSGTVFENVI